MGISQINHVNFMGILSTSNQTCYSKHRYCSGCYGTGAAPFPSLLVGEAQTLHDLLYVPMNFELYK